MRITLPSQGGADAQLCVYDADYTDLVEVERKEAAVDLAMTRISRVLHKATMLSKKASISKHNNIKHNTQTKNISFIQSITRSSQ